MAKTNGKKIKQRKQLALFVARYYKLIVSLIVILILFISYMFLIGPKYLAVMQGGEFNIETLTRQRDQQQSRLNDLQSLIRNYDRISETDINKINAIVPESKKMPELFSTIQEITDQNNFSIISLNVNEEAENDEGVNESDGMRQLTFTLTVQGGSYLSFKELLDGFEHSARLFDITAVHFVPETNAYTVNLATYYFE